MGIQASFSAGNQSIHEGECCGVAAMDLANINNGDKGAEWSFGAGRVTLLYLFCAFLKVNAHVQCGKGLARLRMRRESTCKGFLIFVKYLGAAFRTQEHVKLLQICVFAPGPNSAKNRRCGYAKTDCCTNLAYSWTYSWRSAQICSSAHPDHHPLPSAFVLDPAASSTWQAR